MAVGGWCWMVADIFWLLVGGVGWWWIYFGILAVDGWWWIVVGGCGWWHSLVLPKNKYLIKEKYSFQSVSIKDVENAIKIIPSNKASGGDIPIQKLGLLIKF